MMTMKMMTMLQTESSAWVQSANWFRYARGEEGQASMRGISWDANSDFVDMMLLVTPFMAAFISRVMKFLLVISSM